MNRRRRRNNKLNFEREKGAGQGSELLAEEGAGVFELCSLLHDNTKP